MKPRSGFVTILGRANAGKSTLLNALVGSKIAIVTDKPQTTRTTIQGVVTLPAPKADRDRPGTRLPRQANQPAMQETAAQIIFLDTPGIQWSGSRLDKQMMKAVRAALAGRDLLLLLVDAMQRFGAGDRAAVDRVCGAGVSCFLLLNKIDRVAKATLLPLIDRYQKLHDFTEVIPISALKGENLPLLLDRIVAHLPEGPFYFPPDHITEQPMRFLAGEIVREKVIMQTRQELPYASSVLVGTFEDNPKLIHIAAEIFVEREGQKGILIGKRGEMLKRVGTLARQEMESILGKKVFLDLHVKVREKWRDDSRFLQALDWRSMAGE